MRTKYAIWTAVVALAWAGTASAVTVPFTEEFASNVSGWENNVSNPLTWVASGGPDGSSYASGSFDFTGFVAPFPGAGPIVFRAHDSDDASGDAFVGNWTTAGVAAVTAWVRHDAEDDAGNPVELTWVLRIATGANFPGAAFTPSSTLTSPGGWTKITFWIDPNLDCSPESFSPSYTCADALTTVANFQLGVDAPQALIDDGRVVAFDVDRVRLVAEPAALAWSALGLAGLASAGRRCLDRG